MPITSVTKDPETLTLTVVADFPVGLQRLWDAYADPRLLERFWGPPTYPATFTRHDMYAGGRSDYYMTGPEGDRSHGYWEFLDVKAPHSFEVRNGFAQPDGTPATDLPSMRMMFAFEETSDGSRMTTTTYFATADDLATILEMGMEQGMHEAMSQIDDVLADLRSYAAEAGTNAQLIGERQARIARIIRGSVDQVWQAHHDADLLQRWLLGPDGWTMPVCIPPGAAGSSYRYEWAPAAGTDGTPFGFEGEVLESHPPYRSVVTERMIGLDGPEGRNELTLTPYAGGTLLSLLITFESGAVREQVLATGMTTGMETSYARLEGILAGQLG